MVTAFPRHQCKIVKQLSELTPRTRYNVLAVGPGYNLVDDIVVLSSYKGDAMPTTSIRIDQQAMDILRLLARKRSLPLQTVLSEAIDCYRRQQFLMEANAAYAALCSDFESQRHPVPRSAVTPRRRRPAAELYQMRGCSLGLPLAFAGTLWDSGRC